MSANRIAHSRSCLLIGGGRLAHFGLPLASILAGGPSRANPASHYTQRASGTVALRASCVRIDALPRTLVDLDHALAAVGGNLRAPEHVGRRIDDGVGPQLLRE